MRLIILLLNIFLCSAAWATTSFWQDQNRADSSIFIQGKIQTKASSVRTLHLDEPAFKQLLSTAPTEDLNLNNSDRQGVGLTITLPLPDGDFATLYVEESTIMSPVLAAKFPDIKTWKVWGDGKKVRSGRIDFTSNGFHAMLTMSNGDTTYIDPKTDSLDSSVSLYHSISLHKQGKEDKQTGFTCNNAAHIHSDSDDNTHDHALSKQLAALVSTSSNIQTYRLAVAATGAFTAQNGGTKESTLAAIVTVINRVNEIYQRDVAIKLVLVANNDAIIYTDATSDPYGTSSFSNLFVNQTTLDNVIGSANYDIGHVFDFVSTVTANGLAQVASVCDNASKAKASSGFRSDLNRFATSMVAHEIGHQFGATHSFSSSSNICSTGRIATSAYEPGSGTSIMSYAGICGVNNIQSSNDPYFHSGSIQQMAQYARVGNGALCASKTFQNNSDPSVEAGASFTIPTNTPIELKGSASDSNAGDSLSYSWEQLNTSATPADIDVDNGDNAIFRIYPPVASATRTIPKLSHLYSGISAKGDLPPQQSRLVSPLLMALLVRDQKAGMALDTTSIFVKDTGRSFSVTSHQTDSTVFSIGEATTVTWDVANTDQSPIACNAVDIYLVIGDPSQGDTPVETLLVTTDNDGQATVVLHSNISSTQRARIKVKCNTNIFFALSPINFSIEGIIEGTTENTFADAALTISTASNSSGGGGGSLNGFLLGLLLILASFKQLQRYVSRKRVL